MAIVRIHEVGNTGINSDLIPQYLPHGVWSEGQNVRMQDSSVRKFLGHIEQMGAAQVAPYFLLPVVQGANIYWLYAGENKAYCIDGTSHSEITKSSSDYTATTFTQWNGGILNGVPIINNGVDDPQQWTDPAPTNLLADLSNWPANTKAAVIRPFKSFLVALYITKSGTEYPYLIKWSHPADPGTVPSTWDETDVTKLAGEAVLSQTPGHLVDCLPLRDVNILYKEDSTWAMSYVGGNLVFRFYKIMDTVNALTQNCVTEFFGQHLVLTTDDVVLHDGQSPRSLLNRRMKKFLFSRLSSDNFYYSHVAHNPRDREIWICFPETGESFCTLALVWNYQEDSIGVRDLPGTVHTAPGVVNPGTGTDTWDSDTDSWNSDTAAWGEETFSDVKKELVTASPASGSEAIFTFDTTQQFDGSDLRAYVERSGIPIAGVDAKGEPVVDAESRKLLKEVWPRAEVFGGGAKIDVYVGSQDAEDQPISWTGPFEFYPESDRKVNCLISGRLLAVRFQTEDSTPWALHGYDLNIQKIGSY